jgi:hypothetical protein
MILLFQLAVTSALLSHIARRLFNASVTVSAASGYKRPPAVWLLRASFGLYWCTIIFGMYGVWSF